MTDFLAYGGLFLAAFLAGTVLPGQSEVVMIGLIAIGDYPAWALVIAATFGNLIGSILNWWLGLRIERYKDRKWFPVKEASLLKAQDRYKKYGRWALLFTFVPIIGDPVSVVAGVLREKFWVFLLIVGASKTLRYVFVAYFSDALIR